MLKSIQIDNITFKYPGNNNYIFKNWTCDIDFDANNPNTFCVLGESASGKSTFLKILCGEAKLDNGNIRWIDENKKIFQPIIAYLPQEPLILTHLSVKENIELFSKIDATKKHYNQERLENICKKLDLLEFIIEERFQNPECLSGGQKQRVLLARALSINPDVLLFDEPCTGMGPILKSEFLKYLRKIICEANTPTFYVTHHKEEVDLMANKLIYLQTNNSGGKKHTITTVGSYRALSLNSPTIEINHSLNGINSMVFECFVENRIMYLLPGKIFIAADVELDDDEYRMVAIEDTLKYNHVGKVNIKKVHTLGAFHAIELENGEYVYVKNIAAVNGSRTIDISGPVKIYKMNGYFHKDLVIGD